MSYETRHLTTEEKIAAVDIIKELKEEGASWTEIKDVLDAEFNRNNQTPRTYQRIWREYETLNNAPQTLEEIQREKYKNADILREYRNDIRTKARLEVLLNSVEEGLKGLEPIPLPEYVPFAKGNNKAVVNISDWHIGSKHSNFVSEYSLDIAKDRINKYADEVIEEALTRGISEILILNLGDMVEGFIHISTRIQAELDAVDQTIQAAELVAQFIAKIHKETGARISVGMVLDNHSRIHPNKKDHIEKESLGRLIEYIYKLRLKDYPIEFIGNAIDYNIGYTVFAGYRIAWVHGHLDTPAKVKQNVEKIIGATVDLVYIAHRHHVLIGEDVIQVGSMKGTDEYSFDHRLVSRASQTMTIFERNNIIHKNIYFEKVRERKSII